MRGHEEKEEWFRSRTEEILDAIKNLLGHHGRERFTSSMYQSLVVRPLCPQILTSTMVAHSLSPAAFKVIKCESKMICLRILLYGLTASLPGTKMLARYVVA